MAIQQKLFSIIDRVGKRRLIIYFSLMLCLFIPVFSPIGIPFSISEYTTNWHDSVEGLEEGDIVLIKFGGMPPHIYGMLRPSMLATFNRLYEKGVKSVVFLFCPEDWMGMQVLLSEEALLWPRAGETGYGESWLFLSAIPGYFESFAARMATEPLKDILPVGWTEPASGELVSSFPLWDTVKDYTISDYSAVFCVEESMNPTQIAALWSEPLNYNKILYIAPTSALPRILVYIPSNFQAVLAGMRGGAEYERLLELAGTAVKALEVNSIANLAIILIVLFGNIEYLMRKKKSNEAR